MLRTAVKWVSDPNNPQPGVLGCGVRRGTHCAPAALRSNNHGESVDEAGMSCGTPATPRPARPRRIQKGWGANSPSGRRCARPEPLGRKRRALRRLGRAQQWPVWMLGCSFPTPIWLRLRRGGCGVSMRVGARMPRQLTRRGCPSAARQRVASSTAHPATAPTQVCPVATRRGRRLWVAFLLGTFLWRSKEQVPRPPGRDPAPALSTSTSTSTTTYRKLTRTSPPAKSPPRATPRTTPSQSTRPPPSH